MSDDRSDSMPSIELPNDMINILNNSSFPDSQLSDLDLTLNSFNSGPLLKILEQPKSRGFRFRYGCEGPSHGGLPGETSQKGKRTYPSVEIINYKGDARIVVSLVTDEEIPRPHAHFLVGKHCENGICTVQVGPKDMTACFQNLGVQHVTRKEVIPVLKQRMLEHQKVYEALLGRRNPNQVSEEEAEKRAKEMAKDMDLSKVRLCFQAYLRDDENRFTRALSPVLSNPVYDSKAPNATTLKICRMDKSSGKATGGDEVYLLCDKVQKDDIDVRFFEVDSSGEVTWEASADFGPTDVHRQYAIVFRTPAYRNRTIERPVAVQVQLRRKSDGESSDPKPFTFHPPIQDREGILRKRKKPVPHFSDHVEGRGGQGGTGGGFFPPRGGGGGGGGYPFDQSHLTLGNYGGAFGTYGTGNHMGMQNGGVQQQTIIVTQASSQSPQQQFRQQSIGQQLQIQVGHPQAQISQPQPQQHQPVATPQQVLSQPSVLQQLLKQQQLQQSMTMQSQQANSITAQPQQGHQPQQQLTPEQVTQRQALLAYQQQRQQQQRQQQLRQQQQQQQPSNIPSDLKPRGLPTSAAQSQNTPVDKPVTTIKIEKPKKDPFDDLFLDLAMSLGNDIEADACMAQERPQSYIDQDARQKILRDPLGHPAVKAQSKSALSPDKKDDDGIALDETDGGFKDAQLTQVKTDIKDSGSQTDSCNDANYQAMAINIAERTADALQDFARTGDVRMLLAVQRFLCAVEDENGDTPLHLAVIHKKYDILFSLLSVIVTIPDQSVVNHHNRLQQTPLHLAIITGQPKMVEVLLRCGADPNILDQSGFNALHLAVEKKFYQGIEVLLHGPQGKPAMPIISVKKNDLNLDGCSALHMGVSTSDDTAVKMLIKGGAAVNIPDGKSGRTPLHYAVIAENFAIISYLVADARADLQAEDFAGNTPLHMASALDFSAVAALLIAAGADPEMKNCDTEEEEDEGCDMGEGDDDANADVVDCDTQMMNGFFSERIGKTPLDFARSLKMEKILRGEPYIPSVAIPEPRPKYHYYNGQLSSDFKPSIQGSQESMIMSGSTIASDRTSSQSSVGDVRSLPVEYTNRLVKHLDVRHPLAKDWRAVADQLGMGNMINHLRLYRSPTQTLLDQYALMDGTLAELYQAMEDIGRKDAVNILNEAFSHMNRGTSGNIEGVNANIIHKSEFAL